jgi:hypothetical protein
MALSRNRSVTTVVPGGNRCPKATSSQYCTVGDAEDLPKIADESELRRHGAPTELPPNRQEKSKSALVMVLPGPKSGGSILGIPSKFGRVLQSTAALPFPIGFETSICRSGLPSAAGGEVGCVCDAGSRPLAPTFPSTTRRQRPSEPPVTNTGGLPTAGVTVGVRMSQAQPDVPGQGTQPSLDMHPAHVTIGPASFVVGVGGAVCVGVRVAVRVFVGDSVGVIVRVGVKLRVGN